MADIYKKIVVSKDKLPNLLTRELSGIASVLSASVGTRLDNATSIPVIAYTTPSPHNLKTGDVVQVSGISPTQFNISPSKIIVLSDVEFSVDKNIDSQSSYVSGGSIDKITGNYVVRFRLVSEDRNRFSYWSPNYVVSPAPQAVDNYSALSVSKSGDLLLLSWSVDPSVTANSYDVFIAWGAEANGVGLTEYVGSTSGTFFTVAIPVNQISAQIWIQTTAIPRRRVPDITVASTNGVISLA